MAENDTENKPRESVPEKPEAAAEQQATRSFADEVWARDSDNKLNSKTNEKDANKESGKEPSKDADKGLKLPEILFTDSSKKSDKESGKDNRASKDSKDLNSPGKETASLASRSDGNGKKDTLPNPYDKFDHKNEKNKDGEDNVGKTDESSVSWRGNLVSLETKNGVPSKYKDAHGHTWNSEDGKGWLREGEGTVAKQAKITIDKDANEVREETPNGLNTTYKGDGSVTQSFKTKDGKDVSLTKNADGSQTLVDGDRTWESKDGKTWKSGSEEKQAEYRIDENARLLTKDSKGKELSEKQSAETSAVTERMAEMEKQYNIKFGRPDKAIEYEKSDGSKLQVDLRLPSSEELKVVEEGLQKYAHVARKNGKDFGGMEINFTSSEGKGAEITEKAYHLAGPPPSITLAPSEIPKTRGWDGLEGTFVHEMAHQLQEIRWKDSKGEDVVPKDIERFFGYEKVNPPHTKEEDGTYRVSDRDGKKFQFETVTLEGKEAERWMPVGKDGKVSTDPKEGLTNKEMRERMSPEKKPSTNYFPHPQEAHAEAMAMLVHSPERLQHENPALYQQTKKWDQADINYRHGFTTGPDGRQQPKMMRGADGNIVPNNAENRKAVSDREESWKKNPNPEKFADAEHATRRCKCHA